MPKVYLTQSDKADEAFRRMIKVAMAREGIDTQKALAKRMKSKESTLSYRLHHPDSLSVRELRHMRRILKLTADEIGEVI